MVNKVRIDGIYDQRTLKHLKLCGIKSFCFDFSPKSFNFIQEHVFLEQIIPQLSDTDRIFVHFNRSNDPMINKLTDDVLKTGFNLSNLYFEFDEWATDMVPAHFKYNYLLHFSSDQDTAKGIGKNFCGFTFDFSFFEDLFQKNLMHQFSSNFYTRFGTKINESHFLILKMRWKSNIIASLFDFFEFNLLTMPINSDIEICYRNVDLKKLSAELVLFKGNKFLEQDF